MITWFDDMQQKLADMIDPTDNNVGHFGKQLGFANGGLADTGESSDLNILQKIVTAAKQSTTGADASVTGGRYGDSPLGSGFYNSPAYLMQHFSGLGKFFTGSDPGSKYTDHYTQPVPDKPVQSDDPNKFYNNWYENMRRFAQASEVASRGQEQIRSR